MKRIVIYMLRNTDRPEVSEMRNFLATADQFKDTEADIFVACNGSQPPDKCVQEAKKAGRIKDILDFEGDPTYFRTPQAFHDLYQHGIDEGYEIVCNIDDDAFFKRPEDSIARLLRAFEAPKVAATGPINELRLYRRLAKGDEIDPNTVVPLNGRPWMTGGFQAYRASAFTDFDFEWMWKLKFRQDVQVFMLFHIRGWLVGEIVIPGFIHRTSNGLWAKRWTPDLILEREMITHHDYATMEDMILALPEDAFKIFPREKYLRDLEQMHESEVKVHCSRAKKFMERYHKEEAKRAQNQAEAGK